VNNLFIQLQEMVFIKDIKAAKSFFELNNLKDYIYSNELSFEEWFPTLLFASMVSDRKLLEDIICLIRERDLVDFEECVFNHQNAFFLFLKGDIDAAIDSMHKSINYLNNHREKIIINEKNYGRDYKAMVYNSLGFIFWKKKKFYEARHYVKLAADIFGYKTKNIRREQGSLLLLSSIEMTLANYSSARQHLRKIERKTITDISSSINNSLIYLYYLEENYKESTRRIEKFKKIIKSHSIHVQFNYYVKSALVYFAQKEFQVASDYVKYAFLLADSDELFYENEGQYYKSFYEIITAENPSSNDISTLNNEIIPFFIENGLINYVVLAMKYLERVK